MKLNFRHSASSVKCVQFPFNSCNNRMIAALQCMELGCPLLAVLSDFLAHHLLQMRNQPPTSTIGWNIRHAPACEYACRIRLSGRLSGPTVLFGVFTFKTKSHRKPVIDSANALDLVYPEKLNRLKISLDPKCPRVRRFASLLIIHAPPAPAPPSAILPLSHR